jgi:hypothetical protein
MQARHRSFGSPRSAPTVLLASVIVLLLAVPGVLGSGSFPARHDSATLPVRGAAGHIASPATVPRAPSAPPPLPPGPWAARGLAGPATPCDGPWPAFAGLGPFPAGCVGRDQAVAGFYSNLPNAAGNVSLQLTLPIDRSPTANQSDLYRAIWVGLVLSDPNSWMSQCLLEIRFQPDSAWTLPSGGPATSTNNWTGSVVGYETDATSSTESACFQQPLTAVGGTGSTYLNMTGGDSLNITTVGWAGSAVGEQISVMDVTTGVSSLIRGIVDNGTPLNPAYSTSTVPDGVAGAAAQIAPVSFGVELAGGANPTVPSNSTYGGCSPGVPPPTSANGAVPCPSYDPASWANDTAAPILLTPPVFSAGAARVKSTELLLASTAGGTAALTTLSNGTCAGRMGSAYCTYPWFSYSCGAGAVEFGATDYSGVTIDFGKENQFASTSTPGLLTYPQFPSNGFAVPTCGAGTQNVTVGVSAGSGLVRLLAENFTTPTSVAIPAGAFAISAVPALGQYFTGWTTTGSASVASGARASTTLSPNSGGSVVATFSAAPSPSNVTFLVVGGNGSVVVGGGPSGGLPTTVATGTVLPLAAGAYALQAAPGPQFRLLGWASTGVASVSEASSPATWLFIPVGTTSSTLTATVGTATGNVTLVAKVTGNGTVTLNGTVLPYHPANATTFGSVTGSPGTYPATATPAPGWTFLGWKAAPGAVALPDGNRTNVTVVDGTAYLQGEFAADVTVLTNPGSGGLVSINNSQPVGNGSSVPLKRGAYALAAAPASNEVFQRWQVSDPQALSVARPAFPFTRLVVNSSATLTAVYAPQPNVTVTFLLAPGIGGFVQFNFQNLTANSTVNTTVVNTTYEIKGFSAVGYKFIGFTTTGPVSVLGGQMTVTGTGGVVTAKFGVRFSPVTFVVTRPGAVALTLNGVPVVSGTTLSLAWKVYNLSATILGTQTTFVGWSSLLPVTNASSRQATVRVDGSGTVSAIAAAFVLSGLQVTPTTVDVGSLVHFTVYSNGTGSLAYRYLGLPPGCSSTNTPMLSCRPTSSGTYPIRASLTDGGGAVEFTPSTLLTVVGDPMVGSFTVTPASVDPGFPVTLLVTVVQGLGPYSFVFSGLPTSCPSANRANLTCTPSAAGVYDIDVLVNDSLGVTTVGTTALTVNPPPSISSVTASHPAVDVGVATVLTVTATGGTGGLQYSYANLPAGCASTNGPTLSCTPTAVVTANVSVTVRDSFGLSATAPTMLVVNPRPNAATLTLSPGTVPLGQAIMVSTTLNGGTGVLGYVYSGLPTGCVSASEASFRCTPAVSGNFSVSVVVTDAFRVNASATSVLTVDPTPGGPGPTPGGSATSGINWEYVALIGLVTLAVAAVLVWRFGRPPEVEETPEPPEGAN